MLQSLRKDHKAIAGQQGFTVLELLVVLAITALALTLVAPMTKSGRGGAELRHAASSTLSMLRLSRSEAIAQNRERALMFDVARRRIWQPESGRSVTFGSTTSLTLVTLADQVAGSTHGAMKFYPDGSSSGGRVTLSNGSQQIQLDVDWLTSVVRQSAGGGDAW